MQSEELFRDKLNINDLNLSAESEINELDIETGSVESGNLRLDIEKLRASTEDAIRKIRESYIKKETELISQMQSEDEKKLLLQNRPGSLDLNEDMSIDDLKQFEIARMEELQNLRRIGHKQSSMFNLSSSDLSTIFRKSLENQGEDVNPTNIEKCSEAIKEKYQKELEEMEIAVRQECEAQFDQNRRQLRLDYENKMNQEITEVQLSLNDH